MRLPVVVLGGNIHGMCCWDLSNTKSPFNFVLTRVSEPPGLELALYAPPQTDTCREKSKATYATRYSSVFIFSHQLETDRFSQLSL